MEIATRRSEVKEALHGVEVEDPYRWLEEIDAPEVETWVAMQNARTRLYFAKTEGEEVLRERLEALWNYDKYGVPEKVAGRLFYSRKTGLQNQAVLYWREDQPDAEPQLLLDPNTLSDDGTVALSGWEVSHDGTRLAYGLSTSGSDWQEWRVRDVATGQDLEDRLRWIKFSGASWAPDGSGFYYSRYEEPAEGEELEAVQLNQKVYFHRLGEPQEKDRLVYARPDQPKWGFSAGVSDDGAYLLFSVWTGAGGKNAFFYRPAGDPDAAVVELIPGFESSYDFLGNDGPVFYFRTDHEAPRYRIIAIDTSKPAEAPQEIVAASDHPMTEASLLGDRIYVKYLADVLTEVSVFGLDGARLGEVELPGVGSIWGFSGRREVAETFYYYSSFTVPGIVYRYDLETGETTPFAVPEVDFDASRFETKQIFYSSKDGTRIPLFLTGPKGLEKTGDAPVYLYGYGGFNVSLTPYYSTATAAWLEMGGWHAVANLRGGGEYGESWHESGIKDRKQNVFDDFQAAAEYLVAEGYTRSERLAIGGGSNGGLLVGACLNQRPDLFGAAIAEVGVFDMLRFDRFTIGWAWTDDYGDPADATDFKNLLAYSPLHNTQSVKPYPATLLMTADHDDRVFPAHSFKFGAALQHAQSGEEPILLRIESKAGHGAGKPTSKAIDEIVEKWTFLARELGMGTGTP